jgi:predicted XRE-type DNA-binding protein
MSNNEEEIELVRGSGNVFRDLGHQNADAEQLRSLLAAEIIHVLNERDLSVRKAESLTGIAAADFSRIRQAKLSRFTIDRLMTILNRLNRKVEVTVTVQPFPVPCVPVRGEHGDAGDNRRTPVEWPASSTHYATPEEPSHTRHTPARPVQQ